MAKIDAYLHFAGNCREAMTFYQDCLGGKLTMQTVGESPVADQMPAADRERIIHARLVNRDLTIMASDLMGSERAVPGNTVSLSIDCQTEDEINRFYERLSSGGKVVQPLKAEFWEALFGQLVDKFGMKWMLNFDQKKAKSEK